MKILLSEWIKTKRTPLRWLVLLLPVVFAALMIWYFSIRISTPDIQIIMFQAFFEVWSALVIPLGAGLLSGMMIHQEELAGSFNGFLGSQLPRRDLYLGKFSILSLLASVGTLLAVLVFIVGAEFMNLKIAWPVFMAAAIMAMIGMIPLLALNLWISLAWGMGASIGVGVGGLMIAALMGTSIGDMVWPFVPWSWPVRLSMLPGAYLLYEPGMAYPPDIISSGFVLNQMIKGLVPASLFFVVILLGGIKWFKSWEGRKVYE